VFQLCFAQRHISSQQPPPAQKSSLARKITSTAKIWQSTPKNRHDGEMVLSKIKLHQSFKQRFFQHQSRPIYVLALMPELVNTKKLEFIQSSDPYKSVPKAGQFKPIQGRIQPLYCIIPLFSQHSAEIINTHMHTHAHLFLFF
jgi:hypothetical protein